MQSTKHGNSTSNSGNSSFISMGIYDRDYLRSDGPRRTTTSRGSGQASPRGLRSVNTWLILICIAVYLLGLGLEKAGFKRYGPQRDQSFWCKGCRALMMLIMRSAKPVELVPGNLGYGYPIVESVRPGRYWGINYYSGIGQSIR